jgi:hypothetical protein
MHYYKYLNLHTTLYIVMYLKAAVSTAIRVVLVAVLVQVVHTPSVAVVLASYVLGLCTYALITYIVFKKRKRECDPLEFRTSHWVMAHMFATINLFVSFPFAPTYVTRDWWLGYLVSELKIMAENIGMMTVALYVTQRDHPVSELVALLFFAAALLIANTAALVFLHKFVAKSHIPESEDHGFYSTSEIFELYGVVTQHLNARIKTRRVHQLMATLNKKHGAELVGSGGFEEGPVLVHQRTMELEMEMEAVQSEWNEHQLDAERIKQQREREEAFLAAEQQQIAEHATAADALASEDSEPPKQTQGEEELEEGETPERNVSLPPIYSFSQV